MADVSCARSGVLIVEDFPPFRTFVSTLLHETSRFDAVYESSDGLEAVEYAREVNPELIIMDIGLPSLNGIEAARRIREFAPTSKIVFLTQEGSREVVEEARNVGAVGYVQKSRAASDLSPAVTAVLQGKQFVSAGLTRFPSADSEGDRARSTEPSRLPLPC